ncbi:MAG: ABC transporter permease [Deinococcales bacterium]
MAWLQLIIKRLFYALILILAVIVLNFLLIQLAPGDPAEVIAGEMGGATEEVLASIRERYGLDKPVPVQLGLYLTSILRGDLGDSYYYNAPVSKLILRRLGPTLLLVVTAIIIALFLGTFLGVIASQRPSSFFSSFVTVFSLVGYAMPVFWTAMMFILLFAWIWPIFPVSDMRNFLLEGPWWRHVLDVAHHLVLPAVTLALIYLAQYSRLARSSMLDVLSADYVRTARAKGLKEPVIIAKHALRNALLPIITIAGLQFGGVISGAVLVETVFNWPGLGTLALDSILRRDYPILMAILLFSSIMVIVFNILTDLCYQLIDPRLKTR